MKQFTWWQKKEGKTITFNLPYSYLSLTNVAISTNRRRFINLTASNWLTGFISTYKNHLDRVKRKRAFGHAQNAQIQIILRRSKVSFGPLLSIHTFCSIQWFCKWTVKALIRLRGCAGWSVPWLSTYNGSHVFEWCGPFSLQLQYRLI